MRALGKRLARAGTAVAGGVLMGIAFLLIGLYEGGRMAIEDWTKPVDDDDTTS